MSITCRNVVLPSPSPDSNQVFSLLRIARLSRPNTSRQTARMSSGIRGGLPLMRPEPGVFGEPGLRPRRFGSLLFAGVSMRFQTPLHLTSMNDLVNVLVRYRYLLVFG